MRLLAHAVPLHARATDAATARATTAGATLGEHVAHWGLIVTLAAIGALKFTRPEAEGIRPLVESTPLLAWSYAIAGTGAVSAAIGVIELVAAALLATDRRFPRAAMLGAALATATFATTVSFLVTAPGAWDRALGFPALGGTGQFLVKDIVLLGVSLHAFARARRAARFTPRD
ncbi:MAG: YkgB family protein [Gemmatimonadaceae bacterium]|nr:YkgB family protein [Gemmatimonadaceae bacterium]